MAYAYGDQGQRLAVRAAGLDELGLIAAFLESAQADAGTPLVDESELHRLAAARDEPDAAEPSWRRFVAERDGALVGYAAVTAGVGDLAVTAGSERQEATSALAAALVDVGDERLQLWMRGVGESDIERVTAAGFTVQRRLGVLGRSLLEPVSPPRPPEGVAIRTYVPERDDRAVVEVLESAYAGTDDAGWDIDELRRRRKWPWFRSEDFLLAVTDAGEVVGLHWLKRRDEATGEVYNLAIHPGAQGSGLGQALLGAGLAHLVDVGCAEVMLWVDLANERAVGLYREMGFSLRWEDVAFTAG